MQDNNVIERNKALVTKYPFLNPRNMWTDEIADDYDYSYTELDAMPEGWRKSFGEEMCEKIAEALKKENCLGDYRILQIKEKYGGLRWYDTGATDEVANIVSEYEALSETICVKCGAPATKISLGWICPWCDACASEMSGRDRFEDIDSGGDDNNDLS